MSRDAPAANSGPAGPEDPDAHLRTDEVRAELEERSVRSGLITMGVQVLRLGVGVGATMALARLLTPADFGLLAMANSLIGFVENFRSGGLSMATVHREEVDHRQVSALFWLNVKLQVFIALGVALLAPALAWFYGEAQLVTITAVMAGGLLCTGLALLHEALLRRAMRFGALMLVEAGSAVAGAAVGVGAALLGAGYWALVLQYLSMSLLRGALAWGVCRWRPARYTRLSEQMSPGLRSMLSYGAHLTGFRIIERLALQSDRIVIGYVSGARPLGLYDNAYRWSLFPFMQIYLPLFNVIMSGLSRVQDDPAAYRAYFRKGLLPVFALPLPLLAFMMVEARAVILLLLGDQWIEAVPLFQLLCVAMFVGSVSKITKLLYLSQGQTKRQLKWGLVTTPVLVLAVLVGVQWGALGVAAGWTLATCLLAYPSLAFCLRTSPLRLRDVVHVVWRPALSAVGAAGALVALRLALPALADSGFAILVRACFFGGMYVLLWVMLPGGRRSAANVLRIAKMLWKQKRTSS